MITVHVLSRRNEIEQILPQCIQLAQESGSTLPSQYLYVPLLWWDLFNNLDGTEFNTKRGTNFLGVKSWLRDFHLLVAMQGQAVVGALPIVSYHVKVPGDENLLRIFTSPGDYQLISRQDIIAAPELRKDAIRHLLGALVGLMEHDEDAVVLPYLQGESPSVPVLKGALEDLSHRGFACSAARTGRRGGVRPWMVDAILSCLRQIMDRDVPLSTKDFVKALISDLAACPPMKLLFPRTRRDYEERLQAAIDSLACDPGVSSMIGTLRTLLADAPIIYPVIKLPADRQTYMNSLGRSSRVNSQNYRNRFTKHGGCFEEIASSELAEKDIDDYLRLHNLRWGDASASLRGEASYHFHRKLCRTLASEGLITMFFARYQDRRVAGCSCIDILGRREIYKTGRDPAYDQWGASRLVMLESILDSIDKGFALYDMGLGWFAYKMSYAKEFTTTWNFFITPGKKSLDLNSLYVGYECMIHS